MTLVGFTALSVEIKINFFTPNWTDMSATRLVPTTLLPTQAATLCSISPTCLWAAAWNT